MHRPDRNETAIGGDRRAFEPTAWTLIGRAQHGSETARRAALGRLIESYWKPVYWHVRRNGHDVEEAKDLTQGFFASLLRRDALRSIDPAKGKFRTFLLAALRHFLCDEYDRRKAAKRTRDFDFAAAEPRFDPNRDFEQDWALTVLERGFVRLKAEAPREARVLEAQRQGHTRYAQLAAELQTTQANIKVLAHRGRKRLRKLLLEELRQTASRPGEEVEELRALFAALSV
ncbi:MAG: sigma-70 family RNA polymerase sigma factor [Kiritimatiellae bacterium]|nr:sigma-70 family RNA polymerase sigma factor [Kiritimatiellia bacterium]